MGLMAMLLFKNLFSRQSKTIPINDNDSEKSTSSTIKMTSSDIVAALDLLTGDQLDQLGDFCFYGLQNREKKLIPGFMDKPNRLNENVTLEDILKHLKPLDNVTGYLLTSCIVKEDPDDHSFGNGI